MKILFVMDPIESVNPKKDSTLAMIEAAQSRGHEVLYTTVSQMFLVDGVVVGEVCALKVDREQSPFFTKGAYSEVKLGKIDVIMMRKDPPFDMNFVYATYLLSAAKRQGALVVNDPQSLRDCNEKLFATEFAEHMTPTLVSASSTKIRAFIEQHKDVIVKPLDGMGGSGIFRLKLGDPNTGAVLETMLAEPVSPIMAQRFIPDISAGDKRILLIDGAPVEYVLARIPAKGETRGNLAAGGTGVAQPLSASDRKIAEAVGPTLKARGLIFVGLDVIGDKITEINVTSPTCIREIEAAYPVKIADALIECIEQKLKSS